ncbi:MAG: TetR/AcrR family transcriptional regulator [Candidatus Limnocylindrales bacterium]
MTPSRLTADERREEVVAAAAIEFASTGYAGTSTDAIARRAGVSQPYLFQLFGTKKELFLAAVRDCFLRTERTFEQASRSAHERGLDQTKTLEEMGHSYIQLLIGNPTVLRLQLQAYAACVDDDIRAMVRTNYQTLWRRVTDLSAADQRAVQGFFAQGMLINVVAIIGEGVTFEDFLCSLLGGEPTLC